MHPVSQNGDGPHVTLGEHTYHVYPQRHAYLANKLGKHAGGLLQLTDDMSSVDDFVAAVGDRAWQLLKVFIPQLMPEYEFRGYATAEAMEAREYNEEYDRSPSVPEIETAFTTVIQANRLDLAKHLGKVVDLGMIRSYVNAQMATAFEATLSQTESSPPTPASD
jgi:hypothetical protein